MNVTPLPLRRLVRPALGALVAAWLLLALVAFDQGAIAGLATTAMSDSGGVLHELFHDARHLLGVPCH
jgi:hypothetical protein